ncbi:MAG: histone deacetylase family protein [Magnetospiraceae bacterium]
MSTILFSHPVCTEHEDMPGHPEQPARMDVVHRALEDEQFMFLDRREAPEADAEIIAGVHDPRYVADLLSAVPKSGYLSIDGDTGMNPHSGKAALRAAGGVIAAVDAVMRGEVRNAFCAMRPPGHHAERARAMGFCLFNNVAIGAVHAQKAHGAERVAVVDFDVHHGNGTQNMFYDNKNLFYASSHQFPSYPGTGRTSETGVAGNIVNAPLKPGTGGPEFRAAYEERVLPALRAFKPDLLIISAGFDGHVRDPLAELNLHTTDYVWVTEKLLDVAAECCDGRVVSSLEGGYDLAALAHSCAAHVGVLMTR